MAGLCFRLRRGRWSNLLLAGTSLVSGQGRAVVYATGMRTEFGRIAHLTQTVGVAGSPLQREIARLSRELPEVEVIALTSVLEDASVVGAVRVGAIGYLLKDTQADELCRAIKAAAAGQVQLSPQAATRLLSEIRAPENPDRLTERENDVLRLLSLGKANKEIAASLQISETTVKTHVSNILMKLQVPSRTQAALYAVRTGLVSINSR